MRRRLLAFYLESIAQKKKGVAVACFTAFLTVLSLLYRVVISARQLGYEWRLFCRYRPAAIVISVGNITVGGTGKTPFTMMLADKYIHPKTAILMRGYKSKYESLQKRVDAKDTAASVGDEALLYRRRVPRAEVYVGKDRVCSARQAVAHGARVLILDDGMQHIQIERDLNICLVDAKNPFGYGKLLPRGLLREPITALHRADLVVITRAEQDVKAIEEHIRVVTQAPIIKAVVDIEGIFDVQDRPIAVTAGQKVALFSGIGNPEAFYESVAFFNLHIVATKTLMDHEAIGLEELQAYKEEAHRKGASLMLCTEKDIVKFPMECFQQKMQVGYIRITMRISEGEETLLGCINQWM